MLNSKNVHVLFYVAPYAASTVMYIDDFLLVIRIKMKLGPMFQLINITNSGHSHTNMAISKWSYFDFRC